MSKIINLFYYNDNFGDELSSYIVRKLTGKILLSFFHQENLKKLFCFLPPSFNRQETIMEVAYGLFLEASIDSRGKFARVGE